jgi:hypothetical protein
MATGKFGKFDSRLGGCDWDSYRPIITRLYIEEKMTLQTVMAIMQRDYSFHAR